ncbi:endoribonuclease L-PSP [Phaeosphaeriaceae sp. PMI808]|nr:endoribonuclease L-PSP [Phaeosphaeriaceae sp. PMI808]
MAPQFFNYPGTEVNAQEYHYSQAVKLGNTVRTSGQGGWDANGKVTPDLNKQIEAAFKNVLKAIQAVDPGLGLQHIYAVRSYHLDLDASFNVMTAQFKKLFTNHRPVWTCVQIGKLGLEGMQVEIEVEAHIPA